MITLPAALAAKLKSNDLRGIKPIVLMYRNKWDAQTNAYAPETTPIDITEQVIKCGTLSTKLDVGEINEYTASNVTLTISDPQNHFVEGTPESYFPDGYQIYGSRIELYAGTDTNNMTPLFYGVIRSLPNHKPEKYQMDISVVSALELLDDVEAKGFSTPYTGETLTLDHQDADAGPVYRTANTGVGGFNAVYANGTKLVEGVDYKVKQLSENTSPALVEIEQEIYYTATITADYFSWKKDLAVEQIVKGLVGLAGYERNTDIRPVVWNSSVRSFINVSSLKMAIGYYYNEGTLVCVWPRTLNSWDTIINDGSFARPCIFPENLEISMSFYYAGNGGNLSGYTFSDSPSATEGRNAYVLYNSYTGPGNNYIAQVFKISNGTRETIGTYDTGNGLYVPNSPWKIIKKGSLYSFYYDGHLVASDTAIFEPQYEVFYNYYDQSFGHGASRNRIDDVHYKVFDDNGKEIITVNSPCIMSDVLDKKTENSPWVSINCTLAGNDDAKYDLLFSSSNDLTNFPALQAVDLGADLGTNDRYLYFVLKAADEPQLKFDIKNLGVYFLSTELLLSLVDLSGQTALAAIKDLALITGYEFGIDRNNIFFFRPRQSSTQPIAVLDMTQLVKINTVTRNFNELATKLTLTFAAAPLEFYANTGARPTPVDKYGVIDKEIDKPQLINYDNPELANAIGPQLLAIYSELPNIITCTGKLNLALELGDIVNLKREMPLTINPKASDYTKYEGLNTFYRACKITGLNYDFTKRQVKYTLRDVSNDNNAPVKDYYEYQTIFPTPLDYKE